MTHCQRCGGTGFIPGYAGIKNGICFQCGGIQTRKPEDIKAMNGKQDRESQVRFEYPEKIRKAKASLDRLDMDSPFETEQERQDFFGYVEKKRQEIADMETELEAAMKNHRKEGKRSS